MTIEIIGFNEAVAIEMEALSGNEEAKDMVEVRAGGSSKFIALWLDYQPLESADERLGSNRPGIKIFETLKGEEGRMLLFRSLAAVAGWLASMRRLYSSSS